MNESNFPLEWVRAQFPALKRMVAGKPVAFLDGPAGSQVPVGVADAVHHYLLNTNANHGGPFATSRESDELLDEAHRAAADLFGTSDPDTVSFGANMTTITLALSRALAATWQPGDEIIVTQLDHDANVSPWQLAARQADVTVHQIRLNTDHWTLDLDHFESVLNDRTRLVAVGYASNATGGINPLKQIIAAARGVGALTFVDAVHYAPHGLIDVEDLDCDFLSASAYKFFGPHVGLLYGRRELLESIRPFKLRPSPEDLPGRWMTGTQNHEGIAGTAAAIEYLASVGRVLNPDASDRRAALVAAFDGITQYEQQLVRRLLDGLSSISGVQVYGQVDADRQTERVPTVSLTMPSQRPAALCEKLGERGVFCWSGNHYALPFTEAAGLEPEGTLRAGLLHYNTAGEVDRLLESLQQLA